MMAELSQIAFLMVGAQRCGTTWVDEALRDHPQVYLPPQKQTYFFDQKYDRGITWYLENFSGVGPQHKRAGEVASSYCLPHAIPKIAAHLPHIRLILAMRNPVDRAYSYYLSRRTLGDREYKTFEEALEEKPSIISRGHYIEQVELLLQHYPKERILFLLYDDLVADDRAYLRAIHEFIGVDPSIGSKQLGQRRHTGHVANVRYRLEKFGLKPLFRKLKRSPAGDALRKAAGRILNKTDYRKTMDESTRRRLIEHYAPFNQQLGVFLKRDLSHWSR
jgi:hypothetical protein